METQTGAGTVTALFVRYANGKHGLLFAFSEDERKIDEALQQQSPGAVIQWTGIYRGTKMGDDEALIIPPKSVLKI